MSSTLKSQSTDPGWQNRRDHRARFPWRRFFWLLVFPQGGQRNGLTAAGLLLILLSIAIGVAAYNSASNILFLTLSLLLGCLILSGVLSWMNFRGLRWRLETDPPFRVGVEHGVSLAVRNEKSFLPTYGVWFDLELTGGAKPFSLGLRTRLDPRRETRLTGVVTPSRRGIQRLRLIGIGSFFPFGFLRKSFSTDVEREVVVWPAIIEYRRIGVTVWQRTESIETLQRIGQSGDLLALRRYQQGDSHRQIHWKASARLRHLMVQQHAAESGEIFSLQVSLARQLWSKDEQFELLCSFAACLAEDLFKMGKLHAAAVGTDALMPIRRLRDLEGFLDKLAGARPTEVPDAEWVAAGRPVPSSQPNLLTFVPEGTRGVSAYVNGERTATT